MLPCLEELTILPDERLRAIECAIIEDGCQDTSCKNHVFWDGLRLNKSGSVKKTMKFKENDFTRSCHNCCLEEMITRPATEAEISEMYGISQQAINKIYLKARRGFISGIGGKDAI